jgi:hypothetical protein
MEIKKYTVSEVKAILGIFTADLYRRAIILGMEDVVEDIKERMDNAITQA